MNSCFSSLEFYSPSGK